MLTVDSFKEFPLATQLTVDQVVCSVRVFAELGRPLANFLCGGPIKDTLFVVLLKLFFFFIYGHISTGILKNPTAHHSLWVVTSLARL